MELNLYSLITAIFVGGAAAYVGSLMVTKRMALVGDALGHVALPGIGLALLAGLNISLGAFAFLFLGVLAIWFLEPKTKLPTETLVGIIFVFSLALGFLITPEPDLLEALFGDISRVSLANSLISAVISLLLIYAINKIYPKIILGSFSEDMAAAEKINVKKYNFIYLLAIAVVVALGVRVVGSLLVGALVVIPPATARLVSRNMRQYTIFSGALGILGCVLGIFLAQAFHFAIGPTIVLVCAALFAGTLIFREK